jgi:methyl-accepting chemotaxis protein
MRAAIDRSQAVIEFSPDGRILGANENFLGALGYSLSEIVGRHSMFVEPSYRSSPKYRSFWDKLAQGQFDAGCYKRIGRMAASLRRLSPSNRPAIQSRL